MARNDLHQPPNVKRFYIIPPKSIPPMPPIPGAGAAFAFFGSGLSVIIAAIVINIPAIEAACRIALFVTRTGSITPSFTRSVNSSVRPLYPHEPSFSPIFSAMRLPFLPQF